MGTLLMSFLPLPLPFPTSPVSSISLLSRTWYIQPNKSIYLFLLVCLRLITWDLMRGLTMEKTDSTSLNTHYLPVVLYLGVGFGDTFHTRVETSVAVLMWVLSRQPCLESQMQLP